MKDLLVFAADADAMAFLDALLKRPQALGIRPIDFTADRHTGRDPGMVQSGPELARLHKGQFRKVLLVWDHHGSGREHRQSPELVARELQDRLNTCTWSGNSATCVVVPELESWLWHCQVAMARHCGITTQQLQQWAVERAGKLGCSVDALKAEQPKELFEHVLGERLQRTVSPRDFKEIGTAASVRSLRGSASFSALLSQLQTWFPP